MQLVAVTVMTAGGHAETFRTTEEHPFYVPSAGWVQVDQLRPGDATTTLGGPEAFVVGISYTGEQAEVFNLEVEGLHDYYVGASGVLVHNNACPLVSNLTSGVVEKSHHGWSKMFGRKPSLAEVEDLLSDVVKTGKGMPVKEHIKNGQLNGLSQLFTKDVNGHTVWADVFLDGNTNTMRLMNGGIIP